MSYLCVLSARDDEVSKGAVKRCDDRYAESGKVKDKSSASAWVEIGEDLIKNASAWMLHRL